MPTSGDLIKSIDIWKMQGFETPEELFLVGYIMAHGGGLYFLEQVEHDLDLLAKNSEFWLRFVREGHEIRVKVAKESAEAAKEALRILMEARDARMPDWLKE